MADAGGAGGPIDIKVNIDISDALRALVKLKGEVFVPDKLWSPDVTEGHFEPLKMKAKRRATNLEAGQFEPHLDVWRIDAVHKSQGHAMHEGHFEPYMDVWNKSRASRPSGSAAAAAVPPHVNASPGAQPNRPTGAAGNAGAAAARLGGWGQTVAVGGSGIPKFTAATPATAAHWSDFLLGVSKYIGKAQGWRNYDPTQNHTSNTSFLGSVGGGLFNSLQRFGQLRKAAIASDIAGTSAANIPASELAAGAAVIYKGSELGAKALMTGQALRLGSGKEAMKTGPGKFGHDLADAFDYINNYVPAMQQGFKMTARFDDAVAQVTGKLPDTFFYGPQFHRQASAALQFESMVKRNHAMTKAGAYGSSDPADRFRDVFFNAAANQ